MTSQPAPDRLAPDPNVASARSVVVHGADELTYFRLQRLLGTIGVRLVPPAKEDAATALAIVVAIGPLDEEAVTRVRRRADTVVLTSEPSASGETRVLELGAIGYLPLHIGDDALSTRLAGILAGQAGFSRAALGRWLRGRTAHVRTPDAPSLTRRQREILERIAQGKADKQIAKDLGIATGTVQKHVHMLLRRLRARNRAEAARYAHGPITRRNR